MSKKFLRSDTNRFSRLGKGRKKLWRWRRARGKSHKMRLGRAGYSSVPKVGFKTPKSEAGKINGMIPQLIHNLNELKSLEKNKIAILARVGAKKKLEIMKKADELGIKIINIGENKK